jgi:RNA polymerase sigma factor (TIGR02999 family)
MPTKLDESGSGGDERRRSADLTQRPDRVALDEMFVEKYANIRKLAARLKWSGANPTLGPTDLANAAYLKLHKDPPDFGSKSCEEVIAIFANSMRQILVDATRRKRALKRDPDGSPGETPPRIEDAFADWLTVDAVLEDLERDNPRQRQIVDCRFFLGMTVPETAAALNLAPTTIEREWREAKLYLSSKIRPERP